MRIVIVNNFFLPRAGGSSHIASSLAERFTRLGHEVLVITCSYKSALDQEFKNGYLIHRISSWTLPKSKFSFNFDINFGLKPGNYKKIKKILEDFNPDIIHQHGQFFDLTWQTGIWARKSRVPTVLTLHTRLVSPKKLVNFIFRTLDSLIVSPILSFINPAKIIVIDKEFTDYALSRYRIARKGKIQYISIGVDLEPFENPNTMNQNSKSNVIASVGHVIPQRDRVFLIKALFQVKKKHPDVQLNIIGGIYFNKFLKEAKKLDVEKNINCIGVVQKSEVIKHLLDARMEIHDLQGYGIGISSLEAMACGVPVIMSVQPDYFPHAHLSNYVNCINVKVGDVDGLADAICMLIENKNLAKEIGNAAREYVFNNFDMRNVASKYLRLFFQIKEKRYT